MIDIKVKILMDALHSIERTLNKEEASNPYIKMFSDGSGRAVNDERILFSWQDMEDFFTSYFEWMSKI